MDTLVCPYCDSEVKISMVEAEEGCCPECGSSISATAAYNSYDDDYEDDELDDDHSYHSKNNDFDEDLDEDLDEEEYADMEDEDDNYI